LLSFLFLTVTAVFHHFIYNVKLCFLTVPFLERKDLAFLQASNIKGYMACSASKTVGGSLLIV